MRDNLKNKEYFEEFIIRSQLSHNKRIKKLDSNIIANDRIDIVKSNMSCNKMRECIAKFSIGYSLDKVLSDLNISIDFAKQGWTGEGSWKLINDEGEFNLNYALGFKNFD